MGSTVLHKSLFFDIKYLWSISFNFISIKDILTIIGILENAGFFIAGQKGSHIKLKRILTDGTSQTLTIPNHDELDKGTLKAIYNQTLRYISEDILRQHFYTE